MNKVDYEKEISNLNNDATRLNEIVKEKQQEIERLNNIIYTTLEYVDREEINSTGKPYIYTERGKHIKELLEGERTFNSLWQENKRLNNIISELEDLIESAYNSEGVSFQIKVNGKWDITEDMEEVRKYIQELKGEDKE